MLLVGVAADEDAASLAAAAAAAAATALLAEGSALPRFGCAGVATARGCTSAGATRGGTTLALPSLPLPSSPLSSLLSSSMKNRVLARLFCWGCCCAAPAPTAGDLEPLLAAVAAAEAGGAAVASVFANDRSMDMASSPVSTLPAPVMLLELAPRPAPATRSAVFFDAMPARPVVAGPATR